MTDPSAWRTTTYDEGTRRWVENMSATGRRQATAEAGRRLGDWTSGAPEWRPSRGEVKAWVTVTEDDRRALHNKAEALAKENEVLTAQRDDALEDLVAERTAHDADVAELGDERDHWQLRVETLDVDRTRRARERDTAERILHERTVEMTKAYEELRGAYEQAEGERNAFAHENRRLREELVALRRDQVAAVCADGEGVEGRVECEHGVGVNFTTLRLTAPRGGAK